MTRSLLEHDAAESPFPLFAHQLHRFFWCLDRSDYAALVELTAPDFLWYRQGTLLKGHAAVTAALEMRPAAQRVAHVISNTLVERHDADDTVVGAYMTAYRFDDGQEHVGPVSIPGPLRLSRVTTRFRRVGNGQWLIAEQRLAPWFEFDARA